MSGGILYTMHSKNNKPLFSNMATYQDILFGFEETDNVVEKERPKTIKVEQDSKGVWVYEKPFCKHCNSRKVIKWGNNNKTIYSEEGIEHKILVKRYKCKKCGETSQTEFKDDYDAYCRYPKKIKDAVNELLESGYESLRKQVETLRITKKIFS